jgi:DNA-binding transcriptional ArsR family regulator
MEPSIVTPGLEGLKALSHPGRLRMLGLLRSEGPATATTLAARLGLNSGATSYHLRQLERHGFIVEDAERGNGRDRWWRAAHTTTRTGDENLTTPEEHETFDAYLQTVALVYHERTMRSLEERRLLPEDWRKASDLSDWSLHLTPERALSLVEAIHAMIDEYEEDSDSDPRAAPFVLNLNAFVRPGTVDVGESR